MQALSLQNRFSAPALEVMEVCYWCEVETP